MMTFDKKTLKDGLCEECKTKNMNYTYPTSFCAKCSCRYEDIYGEILDSYVMFYKNNIDNRSSTLLSILDLHDLLAKMGLLGSIMFDRPIENEDILMSISNKENEQYVDYCQQDFCITPPLPDSYF